MNITQELSNILKEAGCEIFGFADLKCIPKEMRQLFSCGILIALPFPKEALQENINGNPQQYYEARISLEKRLRGFSTMTANFLLSKGFNSMANVPTSVVTDTEELRTILPYKTVATLAGVGWIGKCAALVTEKAGSAMVLTTVYTTAPLECGTPITKSRCPEECTVCKDICPGNAPLGGSWEVGVDRDAFFNPHKCKEFGSARGKELINVESQWGCGLCLAHCPFTRKAVGY
ncbi:MAG: epoxyqueuosine reductase [Defluviitaleaceae bacterium]|nr:epoxyqueuosine reductase [Defluviitaleaceae bacterium]